MPFQSLLQESQRSGSVPFLRDEAFQDFALMIDGTPKIMTLTVDFYEDLIEVPAPVGEAFHPADPLAPDISSKDRTKPVPPKSNRFMANVDPALEQQIFNIP